MSPRTLRSKITRVLGVSAAAAAACVVAANPAAAAPGVQLREQCGYLGWGEYRHCDGGTGSRVDLDVQDIWGNLYRYCVGPGTTDLQPVIRWRVTGAWWNGGVGCYPGYEGPA
ncbi:DUF6355 family natural product biosynthesis protein [Amycolatopsis sp. MtRt-6]|uniref:DUF6355 family natural product biosynthesis protein n=1 Tax=Amycolatopsis sp. MtRt-6 TaxID=2792782 RepID=UPI001F5C9549|nr:DUF6355 family natural product biosynthesis protein [Amycolatopsis sp. MtRt-6]